MATAKVFVGNLPFTVLESDLETLFAGYTEVYSVRLVKDRKTGESRGFGFVEVGDADQVVRKLDDEKFRGHNIIVKHAVERGNW